MGKKVEKTEFQTMRNLRGDDTIIFPMKAWQITDSREKEYVESCYCLHRPGYLKYYMHYITDNISAW